MWGELRAGFRRRGGTADAVCEGVVAIIGRGRSPNEDIDWRCWCFPVDFPPLPVLALVDQGNGDSLPFIPDAESSIPANVNVGVGDGVMSLGGMEGAFTCVCPPVDPELNRGLEPLDGEPNGSCAFESWANELSGSAYVMWSASVAVYSPSRDCGIGFEMLDLSSSMDVLPFPVGVPCLEVVDPAPSNLPLVGLDNANAAFSSSYPPPLPPLAYTPLGYPPRS